MKTACHFVTRSRLLTDNRWEHRTKVRQWTESDPPIGGLAPVLLPGKHPNLPITQYTIQNRTPRCPLLLQPPQCVAVNSVSVNILVIWNSD